MGEDHSLGGLPFNWLPILPVPCLWVDEVIEYCLFFEGTLGRDVREGSIDTFKHLLVELLTITRLEETSDGPGKTEAPKFLK